MEIRIKNKQTEHELDLIKDIEQVKTNTSLLNILITSYYKCIELENKLKRYQTKKATLLE